MKIKFQPNALFGVWASIALYFVWFWFACLRMAEHQTERKIGIGKFRATRERSHNIAYAPYITSYIIQVESQGDHRKNNRDLFSFHGTSNISLHRQIQHPSTSEIFSSFFFARFSWFMSMKNFRFLFVLFFHTSKRQVCFESDWVWVKWKQRIHWKEKNFNYVLVTVSFTVRVRKYDNNEREWFRWGTKKA